MFRVILIMLLFLNSNIYAQFFLGVKYSKTTNNYDIYGVKGEYKLFTYKKISICTGIELDYINQKDDFEKYNNDTNFIFMSPAIHKRFTIFFTNHKLLLSPSLNIMFPLYKKINGVFNFNYQIRIFNKYTADVVIPNYETMTAVKIQEKGESNKWMLSDSSWGIGLNYNFLKDRSNFRFIFEVPLKKVTKYTIQLNYLLR